MLDNSSLASLYSAAVGGGSPIDAAKAISYYAHEANSATKGNDNVDTYIPVIAIPTTLSAAETTQNAGYSENNKKVGVSHPSLVPRVIICDAKWTLQTPERLWLSTGMRALDHSIELLYRPDPSPLLRSSHVGSMRELFHLLPATKKYPDDLGIRQRLQVVVLASLWPESRKGALGLSHGLGHVLGATYSIPHGITSCITLAKAIQLTASSPRTPPEQLLALSDALDYIPRPYNPSPAPLDAVPGVLAVQKGDELKQTLEKARKRGVEVGKAVQRLVDDLGLHSTLQGSKVPEKDIETIASHISQDNKELQSAIVGLLQSVYPEANATSAQM
jgi:alcohol dehydrogenase class IV